MGILIGALWVIGAVLVIGLLGAYAVIGAVLGIGILARLTPAASRTRRGTR